MTYTVDQLEEAIEGSGWLHTYAPYNSTAPKTYEGSGWHSLVEHLFWADGVSVIPGFGTLAGVEDHGGGEGSGEERWYVFSVTTEDGSVRHFRKSGYYASFVGSEFDGAFEEVQPAERTITVWEAI